jgi:hypothetical protein
MTQIKLIPKKKSIIATVELLDSSVKLGSISNSVTGHTYALWLRDMQAQSRVLLNSLGSSQLSSLTEAKQSVDLVDLKPQEALQEAIANNKVTTANAIPVESKATKANASATTLRSDTHPIEGWNLKLADKQEEEFIFEDILKLYPQFFTARSLSRFYPRLHNKQVKWMVEGQTKRTLIRMSSTDDLALWKLIDEQIICGQLKPEHDSSVRRAFQRQINQYRLWANAGLIYVRQLKALYSLPPKTLNWDSFYEYGKSSFMIKKTTPSKIIFHYLDHCYEVVLNGQSLNKLLNKLLLVWDTKESQLGGWRSSIRTELIEHYRSTYGIELV